MITMPDAIAPQIELVREALGTAAAYKESLGRRMPNGAGADHLQRADAMRRLCAKLHNHICAILDDDVMVIDVSTLTEPQRDALAAHAAALHAKVVSL